MYKRFYDHLCQKLKRLSFVNLTDFLNCYKYLSEKYPEHTKSLDLKDLELNFRYKFTLDFNQDGELFNQVLEDILLKYSDKYSQVLIQPNKKLLEVLIFEVTHQGEVIIMHDDATFSIFTKPPVEVLQRNKAFQKQFADVVKQFALPDSKIRTHNSVHSLCSANFNSHPAIHRGYYDELVDGVLFVKDVVTGELIRKDASILLTNGLFIGNKSKNLRSKLSSTEVKTLQKANAGDQPSIDYFKNLYMYNSRYGNYSPIDISKLKPHIDFGTLATLFRAGWNYHAEKERITQDQFEDITEFDKDLFVTNFKNFLISVSRAYFTYTACYPEEKNFSSNYYIIPENSAVLGGTVINCGFNLQHELDKAEEAFIKIGIPLNYDSRIRFLTDRQDASVVNVPFDNFPFNFNVFVKQNIILKTSKKTLNNEGRILAHDAKVDASKAPFKMLDIEEAYFNACKEDYKAALTKFKKDKKGKKPTLHPSLEPIFLGVELEYICRNAEHSEAGMASIIKDIANSKFGDHAIVKFDSSMGRPPAVYGMEIVTVPATLAYHKKMFTENFFSAEQAFHKRVKTSELCGMHVHISKKSFTPLDLGKFMDFINSTENKAFVEAMSGRGHNIYAVKVPLPPRNKFGLSVAAKIVKTACSGGVIKRGLDTQDRGRNNETRRVAVNVDNKHTIEVRIFKSSNDKNNVIRKLEFCESLVKFVRTHSTQQMTVYDYINFILDARNKGEYKHLVMFLASKNYIGHERKRVAGKSRLIHVYSTNKVPIPDTLFHKNQKELN